jgi:lipoprotein-anchoring transpeptidase ErfK/SrfK
MLNKLFAAAFAATVAFAIVTPALSVTTPTTTDSTLILKKKKVRKVDASLTTGSITPVQTKKKPIVVKTSAIQLPQARKCTNFFQCLFGSKRRNVNVQQASLGNSRGMELSGKTSSQIVDWNETRYPVGSLIVKTPERALYFVSAKGEAIRYAVGVGREGMQWSGNSSIVSKQVWPNWTPPQVMIEREAAKGHIIPPFMEGGPGNPLGARALYIGGRMYRVHGTNNEASIGGAVSSGCIRMMNADVIDLYDRVKVGAKIYVYQ